MQEGVHLLCNGHFHTASASEADGCSRGKDAFRHHPMHSGDDLRKLFTTAEFHSYRSVAREATRAGENKIAQAGES